MLLLITFTWTAGMVGGWVITLMGIAGVILSRLGKRYVSIVRESFLAILILFGH